MKPHMIVDNCWGKNSLHLWVDSSKAYRMAAIFDFSLLYK